MTATIVALNAHPDDEALMCGGTLALAAAKGHKIVLVTATRGEAGLAGASDGTGDRLGERRMIELANSAKALGATQVRWLGYADSGLKGDRPGGFARSSTDVAARRLEDILREANADILFSYDVNGGYGHLDHIQVHRVARRAAERLGTVRLLEATLPAAAFELAHRASSLLRGPSAPISTHAVFTSRRHITHHVDLDRPALVAKRAALAAHASQTRGEAGLRLLDLLGRVPPAAARAILGREWFVDPHAPAGPRVSLFPLDAAPVHR